MNAAHHTPVAAGPTSRGELVAYSNGHDRTTSRYSVWGRSGSLTDIDGSLGRSDSYSGSLTRRTSLT